MKAYFVRILLQHLAFGFTIPISTVFMVSRGLSLTEIASVNAILLAVSFVSEVPTGYVSDRFGRKSSIVLSSFVLAISTGIFAVAHGINLFILAAVVEGVGFSLLSGADDAFVYDTLKERRQEAEYKKTYGKISIIDESATLIGMLASSTIIFFGGMASVFIIASVLLLLTAVYSLFFLKEPLVHDERHENIIESFEESPTNFLRRAWSFVKTNNELLVAMVAFSFLSETGRFLWQPKMEEGGIAVALFGILFAVIKLFSILGGYVVTKQNHKTSVYRIFFMSLLGTACFLVASLSSIFFVIAGIAVYSFVESLYRAYKSDYLNERSSTKLRATTLSTSAMFVSVGGVLFSILLGAIADNFSLTHAFLGIAAIQLIGGVLILSNRRFNA